MKSDPTPAPAPLLVDRRTAARMLGVGGTTLDALRQSGELPSLKIGARRLFDVRDLEALIDHRKAAAEPSAVAGEARQ